jgi:hypothetical protein
MGSVLCSNFYQGSASLFKGEDLQGIAKKKRCQSSSEILNIAYFLCNPRTGWTRLSRLGCDGVAIGRQQGRLLRK